MYEIFEKLCEEKGVTPYRVCKETGITTDTISNWKAGRYTPKQQAQFSRQNSTAQDGPHVRCPRCGSSDLEVISDVQGKGASFWKLCCCGLLGLCGTGKTTTTHYWVCKSCGNKFKV